ncbi:MAG: biopolymer transporter ExbD [Gammaproteobacteria bacterium]
MRSTLRPVHEEAELDITAFMNLMIVLVPVLLMSMVFSHITVLELRLPQSVEQALTEAPKTAQQLELEIRADGLYLYYPSGQLVRSYSSASRVLADYDDPLVADLKAIKQRLLNAGIDKKDLVLMPEEDIDYQTVISVMDRVRSYRTVLAAEVVNAELFPEISFADASEQARSARQAKDGSREVFKP